MSVTSVEKDPKSLTMTVTAELDATVERVWQLWADPRQFEQWWGPPGFPATVVDHDLRARFRAITEHTEHVIDGCDPTHHWAEIGAELEDAVATGATVDPAALQSWVATKGDLSVLTRTQA